MYETPNTYTPPAPAEGAAPPVVAPPRRGRLWPLLLLLLLVGGLGYLLFLQQQRITALAGGELREIARLRAQGQSQQAELAQLRGRIEEQERALAAIGEAQRGDPLRLQLQLVEHLLLTASERAQLWHDADAARLALGLAEARLAALREPRLFKLRESIAAEQAALARVSSTDRSSAVLELSALIANAGNFPLAARAPERFEPPPSPAPAAESPPAGWLGQGWAKIQEALSAMFSVRRARGPAPRLLTAEQEVQVQQILLLRLEAARVALLRGEQPALRESCAAAAEWLRQRYQPGDAGVSAALEILERSGGLAFDTELPDLSGSLVLLREQLAGSAR